jgi:hypothetical protein
MKILFLTNASGSVFAFLLALALFTNPVLAIDKKMLGSWSASPQCEDDMTVHIRRNEYTGVDQVCSFLRTTPEKGGWRVTLRCIGGGEDYSMDIHLRLLDNGRLRQSAAGLRTIEMRRC